MYAYLISGYFFTAILGTLSHFFYEWSGKNALIGLFSPINESTWEHMKLVFFPVLFYTLFLTPLLRLLMQKRKNSQTASTAIPKKWDKFTFRSSLLLGNLLGTLSIPLFFYTYSGILGKNLLFIDILIFLAGLFIAFYFAQKWKNSKFLYVHRRTIYLLTILFIIAFFVFTFFPPKLTPFIDFHTLRSTWTVPDHFSLFT